MTRSVLFGLFSILLCLPALSQPPVDVNNLIKIEYDDNIFTTGEAFTVEKEESFKIIEQIELLLDTEQGATYFGIRYSPSVVYYTDRPDDDLDLNHQLDLILTQDFTPRSTFRVNNTFRRSEEPELIQDDVLIRKNNDFFYNALNASYTNQLVPDKFSASINGRYALIRYDDNDLADFSDYDQVTVGADVTRQLAGQASVAGQVRYATVDYDSDFRDSDSYQIGAMFAKMLNPRLQAEARAGWEYREADSALEDSSSNPYVESTLVYLPAETTTIEAGIGYAQTRSPINEFTQQLRTMVHGQITHKLSPAISLNVKGSYSMGDFDVDDSTPAFNPATESDGEEAVLRLTTTVSYEIDVRNSVLATYQYSELDSDVRPASDFDRNRISLGWKYNL